MRQLLSQLRNNLCPILSTHLTLLFLFHNASSYVPIGLYHLLAYSRISTLSALLYDRTDIRI